MGTGFQTGCHGADKITSAKRHTILTVTLNPAIDHIVTLESFDAGSLNRVEKSYVLPGGKGVNVSIVLKSLGVPNKATGFVAGVVGRAYEELLAEADVDHDFCQLKHGQTRINTKVSAQNETEINDIGPIVTFADVDKLCSLIKAYAPVDYLVLSGNVQGGIRGAYSRILEKLEDVVVHSVVDTTGEELIQTLEFHPFLIKPNLAELAELFGKELHTTSEVLECCGVLRKKGARNILVSMGKDGALLSAESGENYRAYGVSGKTGNTVASGDSMVGGFLKGWLDSGSYRQALIMGASAGTATAFSYGIATAERMLEYYEKIKVKEL